MFKVFEMSVFSPKAIEYCRKGGPRPIGFAGGDLLSNRYAVGERTICSVATILKALRARSPHGDGDRQERLSHRKVQRINL
jgi:hypothetical protein